ncbi:Flp pilus assembly protein protease CpaA [Arthrobacter tumbae]|nr:Flp pilus assembly protein protease CpaA [Arthrobacter tumbae]
MMLALIGLAMVIVNQLIAWTASSDSVRIIAALSSVCGLVLMIAGLKLRKRADWQGGRR